MKILHLEDSLDFAQTLEESLVLRLKQFRKIFIDRVATEIEFRQRLSELAAKPFDVAIFDVMINWGNASELETKIGQNPPLEVRNELDGKARKRAGLRCMKMYKDALSANSKVDVPCIVYTILDEEVLSGEIFDFTNDTQLVIKQGDLNPLVAAILRATKRR